MVDNAIALQVQGPDFANSFNEGAAASQNRQLNSLRMDSARQDMAQSREEHGRKQALEMMSLMGSIGLGTMGGDINGQADPEKWEQGLDYLDSLGAGLETAPYRGKPQMAKLLVDASITAAERIKMARDDRDFQLSLAEFQRKLDEGNTSKVPAGYQRTDTGMTFVPGGPADPKNPLNTKKTTGPNLSVTAQKELFEADEAVQSGGAVIGALDKALELNDQALSGPMAGTIGKVGSWMGVDSAVATEELKNLVTSQALDQLKTTFGAMPTEGERKILLEIQGSVDQAPEVRKRIFERAKAMAERRIEFSKQKAARLRSGEYFSEGPGDGQPALSNTDGAAGRKEIGGVTYEQDENGDWFEVE